ncbi:redoxin domain-containing protein [Polaribacter batillariae]|uniref:Redoxin domain-containing protein n=1 Tax=Polaribacter batillariae TaxID=2808900 RepID=A0ABX7SRA4_9FLAO|nr:thioredoxin family protein [Polaribacter batillariae]QTD36774.1 redoxin domain-containing protein [Polaribacter batillariae]
MKKVFMLITLMYSVLITAQTLKGNLKQHKGQQITLTGFNYYKTVNLATTVADSLGNFSLNYPKNYKGMAILNTQDNNSLVFVLTQPSIHINGTHLKETDSLQFINSKENNNFIKYAKDQSLRSNALSALTFLQPLYKNKPLFAKQNKFLKKLNKEQTRLQKEDAQFVANLNKESYIRWFIPYRKMVQEMPVIVRKKTAQIPNAISFFRTTDFNHPNFKTSGLFKEFIEGHYMLLENMGQSLDSINVQMNLSSKYLIDNLQENDSLLNTVADNLYNYFEKRSLIKASEYVSLYLLDTQQCSLNDDVAAKLESYRKMKPGNIAPEIVFANNKKLSDLKTNKLVVFGASWCPHCTKEIAKLVENYKNWKDKNVEIVYISIDTDQVTFKNTYKNLPWQQTYCDFKGWDTQAAKDYYITGTPTYYLLDSNNTILIRPKTVLHASIWIETKL